MARPDERTLGSPARALDSYVDEVARRVQDALGSRLVGVWLVGSAALRDYDPRRDVDVQAVATERLSLAERQDLAARLEHETLADPARGLEFLRTRRRTSAPEGRGSSSTSTPARGSTTTWPTTAARPPLLVHDRRLDRPPGWAGDAMDQPG